MQKAITINGTSYNLGAVGELSFEDFKKEGANSFSKGVSDTVLKKIHAQLAEAHTASAETEKKSQKTATSATAALKSGLPVQIDEDETDTELKSDVSNQITDGLKSTKEKSPAATGKGK